MFTKNEQFITQTKLQELQKQRRLLLAAYDELEKGVGNAPTNAARLQILYSGLRKIQFAGRPLHPGVTNLEPILYGIDQHPTANKLEPDSDTHNYWLDKLSKEMNSGRLRSEVVFVFAALLEEWTKEDAGLAISSDGEAAGTGETYDTVPNGNPDTNSESSRIKNELLKKYTGDDKEAQKGYLPPDPKFLSSLFTGLGFGTQEANKILQGSIEFQFKSKIEPDQLKVILDAIRQDRYHAPSTRRQAKELLQDATLVKEFSDALSIILNDLDDWNWPAEGVSSRASLTPTKWRLFLNEDLPTACLLEILGDRWQKIFDYFLNQVVDLHFDNLQKSEAFKGLEPAGKVTEALRFYRSSFGAEPSAYNEIDIWSKSDVVEERDLWEDPTSLDAKAKAKFTIYELLSLWKTDKSILGKRASIKEEYRDLSRINSYGNSGSDASKDGKGKSQLESMEMALAQINAELKLARTAFPNSPVYILKADLRDYYPSLSHDLLLKILEEFGLDQTQLEFFRRYFRTPFKTDEGIQEATQGVPTHRRLADLMGELVMLLLEHFVKQTSRVQIIRLIDDICLIAASEEEAVKAWHALENFCVLTGMALNYEKCGAVCVGGKLPDSLPTQQPSWAMVTLNKEGIWSVDQGRFESYLEQSRQQVLQANSLIARAEIFNNNLNYLVKSLALKVRLDANHRQSVKEAYLRFQNDFFGDNQGIVKEFQSLIQKRFFEESVSEPAKVPTSLPDGWLHWPITAGGLSLIHPLVVAISYENGYSGWNFPTPKPEERNKDWQQRYNNWMHYFNHYLTEVKPSEPSTNRVMETLVKDFIERGSEISLGGQKGLSAYWRWILYIYGPEILDRLGTFRFLFTELVPAQLITGKFRQELELEGK